MNRSNIWVHLGIAMVLVTLAAVLGQIDRWRDGLRPATSETRDLVRPAAKPTAVTRSAADSEPEVLVRFKSGVTAAQIEKYTAKFNDRIEDSLESVRGLTSIDDLDNASPETVAAQYVAMSDIVEYAHPNYQIAADIPEFRPVDDRNAEPGVASPNDPHFAEQWGLNNEGQNGGKKRADIDALKAWATTQGSDEVVVAVLDTGVDYTHSDLVNNMWVRPDSIAAYSDPQLGTFNDRYGFNAQDNLADPMDDNGHGTHCAGIIGAEGDNEIGIAGINFDVQIMPLKFLGRGGFGSTKDAIEAINYAIDRKQKGVNVRIISASWGSTQRSRALEDAIRAAGENGILFVAAAGNSSTDNDKRPHFPSNYDLPNVISVASLDNSDVLSSFSNFGAKTVHVAAPGRNIVSTWLKDSYREASGTSMATPHVAGIAALVIASEPDITVEKLRERIIKSVDNIDLLNGRVVSAGRINAAKALVR
ncbi:MAG: S8 family serine peptidase [Pyrinomonadaceae bacterium]|nr:S8 family serine peptidase [Pyrinomonadaceae bacterium]